MSISDSSDLLTILIDQGRPIIDGCLAEAFRNIGRDGIADDITIATCWDADRLDLPRVGIG